MEDVAICSYSCISLFGWILMHGVDVLVNGNRRLCSKLDGASGSEQCQSDLCVAQSDSLAHYIVCGVLLFYYYSSVME